MLKQTNRHIVVNTAMFFILFLLVSTGVATPQNEQIDVRRFDNQTIDQLKSSDAFFYLDETRIKTDYKAMFFSWMQTMLNKIFGSKIGSFILGNIHYFLILLAAILILYKITNISFASSSYRINNNKYSIHFDEIDHVEKIDFDILIQEALLSNNYRLAIRYQYLNMLKKLSVAGLIIHSPHKTNIEYTYELVDAKLRDSFKQIAFIFDYVWYGENKITNGSYSDLQPSFSRFEDALTNTDSSTKV